MVAVCHRVGTEGDFTDSIEDILAFDGEVTFDGVYTSVFDHRHLLAKKMPILFVTGNKRAVLKDYRYRHTPNNEK